MRAYKLPPKTIPRAKEHHQDWLEAIRNGRKAGSDFSCGGPLTEIAMLGVIAIRLPGAMLRMVPAPHCKGPPELTAARRRGPVRRR
jgi:hypothetical protein